MTDTELAPGMVPDYRPSKVGFLGVGYEFRVEYSAKFSVNGKWDVSYPWHKVVSKLTMLSSLINCSEVTNETRLRSQSGCCP